MVNLNCSVVLTVWRSLLRCPIVTDTDYISLEFSEAILVIGLDDNNTYCISKKELF